MNFPYSKVIIWLLIVGFPTLGFYLDFFGLRSKTETYLFKKSQVQNIQEEAGININDLKAGCDVNISINQNLEENKIINYNIFIQDELSKADKKNVVLEKTIKEFFLRLQLSLTEARKSVSPEQLKTFPNYLQMPYDMIIAISTSHGVGVEFTIPSKNPEINIILTDIPIEKYCFSKYTEQINYSELKVVANRGRHNMLKNCTLIASKGLLVVGGEGDLLFKNCSFKYSEEDTPKNIEFLWLFGSNQVSYWSKIDPVEEAKYLFNKTR